MTVLEKVIIVPGKLWQSFWEYFSTFDPIVTEILVLIVIDAPRDYQVIVMNVYVAEGHAYQRNFAVVGSACNLILITLLFWTLCYVTLHTSCLKGNVWCTVIQTLCIVY